MRAANIMAGLDSDEGAEADDEEEQLESFVKSLDEKEKRHRVQERPLFEGEKEQLEAMMALKRLKQEGRKVKWACSRQMYKKYFWSPRIPHMEQ